MPKAKGLYTKGLVYSIVEAHNNSVLMKRIKYKERK